MLVTDLKIMEDIVKNNKNLTWEGWDVVFLKKSDKAMFSPDGVYKEGSWYKKKIFPITKSGWSIPKNVRVAHAEMER